MQVMLPDVLPADLLEDLPEMLRQCGRDRRLFGAGRPIRKLE